MTSEAYTCCIGLYTGENSTGLNRTCESVSFVKKTHHPPSQLRQRSATRTEIRSGTTMQTREKRREQRFDMVLPVVFRWIAESVPQWERGQTRDVSSRGTFILSKVTPKLGTNIELELVLDGFASKKHNTTLHGKAVVARVELDGFATNGKVKMAIFDALNDGPRKSSQQD